MIAAIDSTTTTALGTMTGSCRPMDFQRKRFFIFGYGLLRLADGWGWFDMGTKYDFTAVTDSSHDSACVVGGFDDFTVFDCESIIVSGTV